MREPLPARGVTSIATRLARWIAFGVHMMRAAWFAGWVFPRVSLEERGRGLQRWSAQLVQLLGVRLRVTGEPPAAGPYMLVSNHISWVDIFVINAAVPTRFIAKSEVHDWLLIGWLCRSVDTLFIERGRRRDVARLDAVVGNALRAGAGMGVFLEGTTTDGSVVLPFHGSLLRPPMITGTPIYPVAISYSREDGTLCTEAAYDGDKTVIGTLRQMFALREIHAEIQFLPAAAYAEVPRKRLAETLRASIVNARYLSSSTFGQPH